MKNLQIGDNDLIGNRFNGHDLHLYLQEREIDSKHLVWTKYSSDASTYEIARNISERKEINNFVKNLESKFQTHSTLYPFSFSMLFDKLFIEADVVHLHLLHNHFFNLAHLPILSKMKPTVWTLHDPWAFTGHCIHPMECERWKHGCGKCPALDTNFEIQQDTTALNWEIKKTYIQQSSLDVIVASKWMYDMATNSPLFSNAHIHLIPFGLNLKKFKPSDSKAAKNKLGIPQDNIVLCFRAENTNFKGLSYIKECLASLNIARKVSLLTFGGKNIISEFSEKFQIVDLGWILDEDKMIEAYNAADIFLMPSRADAFGMMAIEAMACGKPVIVMSGTALEEVIFPAMNAGIVVPQGDVNSLLNATIDLIADETKRLTIGCKALNIANKYYSLDRYITQIIDVYKLTMDRKKGDTRSAYLVDESKKVTISIDKSILHRSILSLIKGQLKRYRITRFLYHKIAKLFLNLKILT
jgi:glycosyltransferase involved in cell wall biosynthesis